METNIDDLKDAVKTLKKYVGDLESYYDGWRSFAQNGSGSKTLKNVAKLICSAAKTVELEVSKNISLNK